MVAAGAERVPLGAEAGNDREAASSLGVAVGG